MSDNEYSPKTETKKEERKEKMNECKYCSMMANGDIPADREDIIFRKVGTSPVTNTMLVSILNDQLVVNYSNDVNYIEFTQEINFCPMCGRKLSKENEAPVSEDGQKK